MMISVRKDDDNKRRHYVSKLTDDDLRRAAVTELNYYVDQLFSDLLKCLFEHEGLEEVCKKYVTERGYDWSYFDMYKSSTMKPTVESVMEMGNNLYEMGEALEDNILSEDERKVNGGYVEDVGFYLVEVGLGLQGIGTLWKDYKDVIELDKIVCFDCLRFDW